MDQAAHYLLCVKGNQPKLFTGLQACLKTSPSTSCYQHLERGHGRHVYRRISVYDNLGEWPQQWPGLASCIEVKRWGLRNGKLFCHHQYYISDLALSAYAFGALIQGHWSIENRLHWPKDMVLNEDKAPQRAGQSPANWSTVRNFIVNIVRKHGYQSITKAMRALANRPRAVLQALELIPDDGFTSEFSPTV